MPARHNPQGSKPLVKPSKPPPSERASVSLDGLAALMADHDHRPAAAGEAQMVHGLSSSVLEGELAPVEHLMAMHERSGAAIWVFHEHGVATGFNLMAPLNAAGLDALATRRFDPKEIPLDWIAARGEPCVGVFHLGFGGVTRDARRAVMTASAAALATVLRPVPVFARALTEDGRRAMSSLDMRPRSDLMALLFEAPPARD